MEEWLSNRHTFYVAPLLAYYAAARLTGVHPKVGTSLPSLLGLRIVPDLVLAFVVGRFAWIGLFRARSFRALREELHDDLFTRDTAERLLGIPLFVFGTVLAFDVYGAFKQAIPRIVPYRWDAPLARIDWLLHFGRDPWTLTGWIPTDSVAFALIEKAYAAWFMSLILTVLIVATWAPLRVRARFFIAMTVTLMVGGTLAAILFASGGPVYFTEFTSDPERFASLLGYVAGSGAREGQEILWEAFATGSDKLYGGISAMPSMHVAMVVLMALASYAWCRAGGVVVAGYGALILVGSVHLGWHYAVDGYASILLAAAAWALSGRLVGRRPQAADSGADSPETEPVAAASAAFSRRSSSQNDRASRTAPQEMAMSATLKIGKSQKIRSIGPMKSTTPRLQRSLS